MEKILNFSKSLPSLADFWLIFSGEASCIEYLKEKNIIPKRERCPSCRKNSLKLQKNLDCFRFSNSSCRKQISIKQNTFFSRKTFECCEIFLIACLWLNKARVNTVMSLTGHSSRTIGSYYHEFF